MSSERAASSSGVSISREDVGAIIRRVATRMHERHERAEQQLSEEREKWAYAERETIYCIARKTQDDPPLWVASTVTEVGRAGIVSTRPEQERFLESQIRLDLARAFARHGMVRDYEEARQRAARATILFADKVG